MARRRRIDRAALVAAYDAGGPLQTLAAQFGVPEHTIRWHLARAGVAQFPIGPQPRPDCAAMLAAYAAGATVKELSARYGLTLQGVYRRLHQATVPLRPWPVYDEAEIVAAYTSGSSIIGLSRTHHMNHAYVSAVLRRAGIVVRSNQRKR